MLDSTYSAEVQHRLRLCPAVPSRLLPDRAALHSRVNLDLVPMIAASSTLAGLTLGHHRLKIDAPCRLTGQNAAEHLHN